MRRILPPHRLTLLAALTLAWALAPAPAHAAPGPARLWPGPEVAAGQVIELSWGELPAGVHEMEILLSLDDGRHFAVRVSPELDAHERSFRWRVPNLPAGRARLRMRLGRERAEIETESSAPFRIVGSDSEPAPQRLVLEGPLWTGFEPLGSGARECLSPAARMEAADPSTAALETRVRISVLRPASVSAAPGVSEIQSAFSAPPTLATCPPRLTPLRN
jgi:hypothetical protein